MVRAVTSLPSCLKADLPEPLPFWCSLLRARIECSGVPLIKLATELLCSRAMQSLAEDERRRRPEWPQSQELNRSDFFPEVNALHTFRQHAALHHRRVELFEFFSVQNRQDFDFGFCFFGGALRADLDFTPELLPLRFLAWRRIYFSFCAAWARPFYRMRTFVC